MNKSPVPVSISPRLGRGEGDITSFTPDGYDQEKATIAKPRSRASRFSQWIERHKTLISVFLTVLTIVIFVATLVMINTRMRRGPEEDKDALEEFAKSVMIKSKPTVSWNDIAGLKDIKDKIQEAVIWPKRRPGLFKGLRRPPKGILLYGPPGTGKTMLAKAVAAEVNCTFFVVSVSTILNKWFGESEAKMNMLFKAAAQYAPTIIFIDEIEALTGSREGGNDSTKNVRGAILSEFLTGMDGIGSDPKAGPEKSVTVIGATNYPGGIDHAVRSRFSNWIHVHLPDLESRVQLISNELKFHGMEDLSVIDKLANSVAAKTNGYSGRDLSALCREASMVPVRMAFESAGHNIDKVATSGIGDILTEDDFNAALKVVHSSVTDRELLRINLWEESMKRGAAKDKPIPPPIDIGKGVELRPEDFEEDNPD
jgi:katanin p60 ATPase-containing subunit A1